MTVSVNVNVDADPSASTADWGERTGAALVDLAIAGFLLVFGIVVGAILIAVGGWGVAAGILLILAGLLGAILYAPLMMARKGAGNGQTIGKRAAKLRVVRDNGGPVTFWRGMLREFVVKQFFGIAVTGGLFWIVDALWPLFDDHDRAVHDMVAETHVVKLSE
jgi:uncharacterized RDD family membrane protein YckC